MFIANTLRTYDNSQQMGHWVVFYVGPQYILFLDSFGLPPEFYGQEFANFSKQKTVYALPHGLQPPDSLTCGLYAVFFVHYISHWGLSSCLRYTMKHFRPLKPRLNDKKVKRYFIGDIDRENPCELWLKGAPQAMTYKECISIKKQLAPSQTLKLMPKQKKKKTF